MIDRTDVHLTPGGAVLTGLALEWFQRVDRAAVRMAQELGAVEMRFPPLIPVGDLERAGYLAAFPHLATFASSVAAAQRETFAGQPHDRFGAVDPQRFGPSDMALVPAACTPLYAHLRDQELPERAVFTTINHCFRHEIGVEPLRRQRAFTMREIVVIGSAREVVSWVNLARSALDRFVRQTSLIASWQPASDPFFAGEGCASAVMQKIGAWKHELVVDDLAIASTNRHGDHFGRAFSITRGGKPLHSGCLAFGLERWVAVGVSARAAEVADA